MVDCLSFTGTDPEHRIGKGHMFTYDTSVYHRINAHLFEVVSSIIFVNEDEEANNDELI